MVVREMASVCGEGKIKEGNCARRISVSLLGIN